MKDMAMVIEELRTAAAAIKDTADWLYKQFSEEDSESPTPAPKAEMKLEEVRDEIWRRFFFLVIFICIISIMLIIPQSFKNKVILWQDKQ